MEAGKKVEVSKLFYFQVIMTAADGATRTRLKEVLNKREKDVLGKKNNQNRRKWQEFFFSKTIKGERPWSTLYNLWKGNFQSKALSTRTPRLGFDDWSLDLSRTIQPNIDRRETFAKCHDLPTVVGTQRKTIFWNSLISIHGMKMDLSSLTSSTLTTLMSISKFSLASSC